MHEKLGGWPGRRERTLEVGKRWAIVGAPRRQNIIYYYSQPRSGRGVLPALQHGGVSEGWLSNLNVFPVLRGEWWAVACSKGRSRRTGV